MDFVVITTRRRFRQPSIWSINSWPIFTKSARGSWESPASKIPNARALHSSWTVWTPWASILRVSNWNTIESFSQSISHRGNASCTENMWSIKVIFVWIAIAWVNSFRRPFENSTWTESAKAEIRNNSLLLSMGSEYCHVRRFGWPESDELKHKCQSSQFFWGAKDIFPEFSQVCPKNSYAITFLPAIFL